MALRSVILSWRVCSKRSVFLRLPPQTQGSKETDDAERIAGVTRIALRVGAPSTLRITTPP